MVSAKFKQWIVACGLRDLARASCFTGIAVICAALAPFVRAAELPTVDANNLVRQMVQKYQTAQTLQETAETHIRINNGPKLIQGTRLRFKRPNLLALESVDPDLGTLKILSNGRTITLYSGRQNFYLQLDAPTGLSSAARVISEASNQLTGLPLNQVLSPLSFLAAHGMPIEARNFSYVRAETIVGHKTILIRAVADQQWMHTLIHFSSDVVFDRRDVFLWIDAATKTLVRSSVDLIWHKATEAGAKTARVKFQETHHNLLLNLPLRDEDFKLDLPKGAEEKFPTR